MFVTPAASAVCISGAERPFVTATSSIESGVRLLRSAARAIRSLMLKRLLAMAFNFSIPKLVRLIKKALQASGSSTDCVSGSKGLFV